MASLRIIVTEGQARIQADGDLDEATELVDAACAALVAWRACQAANPPPT